MHLVDPGCYNHDQHAAHGKQLLLQDLHAGPLASHHGSLRTPLRTLNTPSPLYFPYTLTTVGKLDPAVVVMVLKNWARKANSSTLESPLFRTRFLSGGPGFWFAPTAGWVEILLVMLVLPQRPLLLI